MMAGIGWAQKAWALAQLRTHKSQLAAPLSRETPASELHLPTLWYYRIVETAELYAGYKRVWL